MTNWTLALALWGACLYATGCEGEISGGTSAVDSGSEEDAGPLPCNITKVECSYTDPETKTDWHCYWVELCDMVSPWETDSGEGDE